MNWALKGTRLRHISSYLPRACSIETSATSELKLDSIIREKCKETTVPAMTMLSIRAFSHFRKSPPLPQAISSTRGLLQPSALNRSPISPEKTDYTAFFKINSKQTNQHALDPIVQVAHIKNATLSTVTESLLRNRIVVLSYSLRTHLIKNGTRTSRILTINEA